MYDLMQEAERVADALGKIADAINHLAHVIDAKDFAPDEIMIDFADELFVKMKKDE